MSSTTNLSTKAANDLLTMIGDLETARDKSDKKSKAKIEEKLKAKGEQFFADSPHNHRHHVHNLDGPAVLAVREAFNAVERQANNANEDEHVISIAYRAVGCAVALLNPLHVTAFNASKGKFDDVQTATTVRKAIPPRRSKRVLGQSAKDMTEQDSEDDDNEDDDSEGGTDNDSVNEHERDIGLLVDDLPVDGVENRDFGADRVEVSEGEGDAGENEGGYGGEVEDKHMDEVLVEF